MDGLELLPGATDFLQWLKPLVPRTFMITDGPEEYAFPIFHQLGHPMVFCNFFEADDEGFMKRLITRLKDQKLKTVQELQRLNFRIIAVGSSFNDIEMLHAAEKGILYRPSESIRKEITDIPIVKTYDELKAVIEGIVTEKAVPNGKRQKTA
mmetsp:Transcript_60762/g.125939  ORF Transcript_60762/g.125939 Transcript_60762/m.125939 type:complete len:152 (-) Transcript_60762:4-459(-)